jgi:hypothetical protein
VTALLRTAYFGSTVAQAPHPELPQFRLSLGDPSIHDHPEVFVVAEGDCEQPTKFPNDHGLWLLWAAKRHSHGEKLVVVNKCDRIGHADCAAVQFPPPPETVTVPKQELLPSIPPSSV